MRRRRGGLGSSHCRKEERAGINSKISIKDIDRSQRSPARPARLLRVLVEPLLERPEGLRAAGEEDGAEALDVGAEVTIAVGRIVENHRELPFGGDVVESPHAPHQLFVRQGLVAEVVRGGAPNPRPACSSSRRSPRRNSPIPDGSPPLESSNVPANRTRPGRAPPPTRHPLLEQLPRAPGHCASTATQPPPRTRSPRRRKRPPGRARRRRPARRRRTTRGAIGAGSIQAGRRSRGDGSGRRSARPRRPRAPRASARRRRAARRAPAPPARAHRARRRCPGSMRSTKRGPPPPPGTPRRWPTVKRACLVSPSTRRSSSTIAPGAPAAAALGHERDVIAVGDEADLLRLGLVGVGQAEAARRAPAPRPWSCRRAGTGPGPGSRAGMANRKYDWSLSRSRARPSATAAVVAALEARVVAGRERARRRARAAQREQRRRT